MWAAVLLAQQIFGQALDCLPLTISGTTVRRTRSQRVHGCSLTICRRSRAEEKVVGYCAVGLVEPVDAFSHSSKEVPCSRIFALSQIISGQEFRQAKLLDPAGVECT
jgi:hypothetical protein